MSPRVPEDIVHPRRQLGLVARPLNCTVKSPLRRLGAVQIRQELRSGSPGCAALAAFDTGGFDPAQQARAAAGSDPFRRSSI